MEEYSHKPLSTDELALLDDWKELTGESIDVSRIKLMDPSQRPDFLARIALLGEQKQSTVKSLLEALTKVTETDRQEVAEKENAEELKKFSKIEKDVLASLPETERKRIATMASVLSLGNNSQKEWIRSYFGNSYVQAIMKLHNKEVIIRPDSVQFLYAHKELYKQELQLNDTKDGDIFYEEYQDFDGKTISRREIRQKNLDRGDKHYHLIQEAQEKLKQESKYIATEENTFNAILNGFESNTDQKIAAMQLLTGFVGRGIISLEKDKNDCRRFLRSRRYEYKTNIYDTSMDDKGSLFVAKDC